VTEVLLKVLWAFKMARHGVIKVTQIELVYGQEAMLLIEINLQLHWVKHQDRLSAEEYHDAMRDGVDEVHEGRLATLREIEKEKVKMARAYNKRVMEKSFQIGGMVWKTILPLGSRNNRLGKWSQSLEGLYKITRIIPGNSYFLEALDGPDLPKAANGKYLKKYHPSVWQGA
jgi:hypothetical protein